MKLSDTKPAPPKILLWGPSGCGKTALAYTLGPIAQVYDFDRGWETGRTLQDQFTEQRRSVDLAGPLDKSGQPLGYTDPDPDNPKAAHQFLLDFLGVAQKIREGTYPFKAIIIDHLTAYYECCMRYAVYQNSKQAKPNNDKRSLYGSTFDQILNAFGVMRALPITIVVIAHQGKNDKYSKATGELISEGYEIGISGKEMPDKIPVFFDESWYMIAETVGGKTIRKVQTQADGRVYCKTRRQMPNWTDTSIGLPKMLEQVGFVFG